MGQIKGGITGILGIMGNEKASKIYQNQKYHKNPTTHDAVKSLILCLICL